MSWICRLVIVLSVLVLLFSVGEAADAADPRDRPNIMLIMVDDMGFSDLGCYGGEIDTPNLDRLARDGLRYTQCYNTARCCPTRACLLTGLYPHKTGMGFMANLDAGKPGYHGDLNRQCATMAEVLRSSGYATYMAGKWHICRDFQPEGPKHNWPRQRGFDRFFGTLIGVGSYWDPLSLTEENSPKSPPDDFYYTEAITDKAVEYLRADRGGKPFFCYVAYTAPHFPLHAREEVIRKYRGRFAQGWDRLRETRHRRLVELGIIHPDWKLSPRDPNVPAWDQADEPDWRQSRMEAYAAAIDHVDQGVGAIVDALAETGQLDNTVILFLSDNGGEALEHPGGMVGSTGQPWAVMRYVPLFTRGGEPVIAGDIPGIRPGPATTYAGCGAAWANLSNAPFRWFKTFVHEGGIATPLVVHWPEGIRAKGVLRHQPVHVIDFLPTFIELAGAEYPTDYRGNSIKPLDGISLVPTFENRALPSRPLFWEHCGNRAVRDGQWKLVATNVGPWELYDLDADRTETHDLAKQRPEIVARLAKLYEDWARRSDVLAWDDLDIPFIPPEDNPLTRTPAELEKYLDELEARRIEAPFLRQWREDHPRRQGK
ncbi:MAG: arylsulfatase [Pirellulales bacterium]|nr:arylsulfatase [Pirellulales bacterium]